MKKMASASHHPDVEEVISPPRKLLVIRHPRDYWYVEGRDKRCHQRFLWLTRGMYLIEEWWKQHNIRITYRITDFTQYYLKGVKELEKYIRALHQEVAPHQSLDQYQLVLGLGATQIIHAAIYAACVGHARRSSHADHLDLERLYFTHQTPGFLDSKEMIETLHQMNARWIDCEHAHEVNRHDLVEIVTFPNNPDGKILKPVTDAHRIIKDCVNNWPFYLTAMPGEYMRETLDNEWIIVFSLAKILSFSGSRVGYAFVKDLDVAHNMRHFIIRDTHGTASDGQIHCLFALKYLLEQDKLHEYIDWITQQMVERWERLRDAMQATDMQLLNEQGPNAWVKTPTTAENYLRKKYRIVATYGPEYGVNDKYARISMTCSNNEYEEMLRRFRNLKLCEKR